MPRMRLIIVLAVVVGAFMALAPSANASWTHLGGDPLFPGGIQGTGQTARNDFVRKMNTGRAAKAMRLAGLNATERKAVRHAVNKGQFKECKLNYGDHFQKMSFGAGTIFVDRNVTFADPSYKGTGAPAFCLTVKVKYKNGKVTTIKIKVPFKCVNISVISKTTKKGKGGCGCKKPPPPKVVCSNTGQMVDSIQQCVTQTQQTTQDCQAGTIKQGNQCVVIQNQCGNVNVGGDNNTQGGNCNVTNNCSNVNSPGGTVNCNTTPTCEQSGTCPAIHIVSWTNINDIPAGRTSGPFHVTVNASAGGGSLTIDPGIGGVSDCASSTPLPNGYTASLSQGNNDVCVILYAPQDASATNMTVTAIATLGSASDTKTQTFPITHPVRP